MTAAPLPGFLNSLAGPLDHFGLWAVLLFVMTEDFGVPVPGETILIAASVYAGAGRLNVAAVAVAGFIAAVTGDNIGFALGRFGGRALALRWGRYVFLTQERPGEPGRPHRTAHRKAHHRSRSPEGGGLLAQSAMLAAGPGPGHLDPVHRRVRRRVGQCGLVRGRS